MLTDFTASCTAVSGPAVSAVIDQIAIGNCGAILTGIYRITIFCAGRSYRLPCHICVVDFRKSPVIAVGATGTFGDLLTGSGAGRLDDLRHISIVGRIDVLILGCATQDTGEGSGSGQPAGLLLCHNAFIPGVLSAGFQRAAHRAAAIFKGMSGGCDGLHLDFCAERTGQGQLTVVSAGGRCRHNPFIPYMLAGIILRPATIGIVVAIVTVSRYGQICRLIAGAAIAIIEDHILGKLRQTVNK